MEEETEELAEERARSREGLGCGDSPNAMCPQTLPLQFCSGPRGRDTKLAFSQELHH